MTTTIYRDDNFGIRLEVSVGRQSINFRVWKGYRFKDVRLPFEDGGFTNQEWFTINGGGGGNIGDDVLSEFDNEGGRSGANIHYLDG
jgi:hypothetical protein